MIKSYRQGTPLQAVFDFPSLLGGSFARLVANLNALFDVWILSSTALAFPVSFKAASAPQRVCEKAPLPFLAHTPVSTEHND